MPIQGGNFLHFRNLPNGDLIKRKPVRCNKLIATLTKRHVANLRASINGILQLQGPNVPKFQSFIGGSSAFRLTEEIYL
jgi:hypothetical protein